MTKESERERQKEEEPRGKAERDALHPSILFQTGGLVTIFSPSAPSQLWFQSSKLDLINIILLSGVSYSEKQIQVRASGSTLKE